MVASTAVIAAIALTCSFRTETYLLASGTSHGWVTIEQGNFTCPASQVGLFIIPASRYLCTSTPTYHGWAHVRYELENADGSRSVLKFGEDIRQRAAFVIGELGQPCYISGTEFFYSSSEELSASSASFRDRIDLTKRPDCEGHVL
jgi:hypothetical protein